MSVTVYLQASEISTPYSDSFLWWDCKALGYKGYHTTFNDECAQRQGKNMFPIELRLCSSLYGDRTVPKSQIWITNWSKLHIYQFQFYVLVLIWVWFVYTRFLVQIGGRMTLLSAAVQTPSWIYSRIWNSPCNTGFIRIIFVSVEISIICLTYFRCLQGRGNSVLHFLNHWVFPFKTALNSSRIMPHM